MMVKQIDNNYLIQRKMDVNKTPSGISSKQRKEKKANIYHAYIKDEAGENVFEYFDELGVFQSNELLILSSKHSFSYDGEYMKHIRIIFNLKLLNNLPKISLLFFKLNNILPVDGYYIGCYDDMYTIQKKMADAYPKFIVKIWFGLFYYLPQLLINIPVIDIVSSSIGLSNKKCLTIREVQKLMLKNGFNVVSTKEFNGRSYFIAKKIKKIKQRKLVVLNFFKQVFTNNLIINV